MTDSKPRTSPPLDLSGLLRVSLADRSSLVKAEHLGRVIDPIPGLFELIESFPSIYAGSEFRDLARRLATCLHEGRPVGLAIGAHVIKCGMQPLIIDLMERGLFRHVALNGAGAVHDFELAICGKTSEDVAKNLIDGTFGLARETFEGLNAAAKRGAQAEKGFGEALGEIILESNPTHPQISIAAAGKRLGIPVTVHVAVGTDIVHMHPGADGAAIGEASLVDFRRLCSFVAELGAGAWMNVGCAVLLPEVFLKAVSIAVNLGNDLSQIATVNLDMLDQYRARNNVVRRPPGRGFDLRGQHEFLFPLLRQAILTCPRT